MPNNDHPSGQGLASHPLHERSDDWLAVVLGRDLEGATLRVVGILFVAGVVLATIAVLVG
jgi:hypothetical protein